MSSASLRLTEPVVFLVGGLEHERARARQRRAVARLNNQPATGTTPPASPGPSSRRQSPERGHAPRPSSLSRPGSRAASPAPRGRLGQMQQDGEFVPPNSRGRSHSRTRGTTPVGRGDSLSRGRDGSLVREMEEAQVQLEEERHRAELDEPPPALLRGLLTVTLSKPSRIKDISVRLKGVARTDWPEGIGPRRLDVMEETTVIDVRHTFFSAAQSSMTRRAASIGPGSGDHGEEARGRSARRAASVMPGRQMSHGRSYPRDSLFPEDANTSEPALPATGNSTRPSTLSRISSEEDLHDGHPPPILPGEAAPAYEVAVDSRPASRATSPIRQSSGYNLTLSTTDFSNPVNSALRRHLDRSPTPSRSPLGISATVGSPSASPNASATELHHLHRTPTTASRLSQESTSTHSTHSSHDRPPFDRHASSGQSVTSSEPEGAGWNSAPVPGSATSSFERGRAPIRAESRGSAGSEGANGDSAGSLDDVANGVAGMTFQPRSSLRQSASPSPAPTLNGDRRRRLSSSSNTARRAPSVSGVSPSPLPSALKGASSSSNRSVSRGTRFMDVLRGKSTSRARAPSESTIPEQPHPQRRTSSPDAVRAGGRSGSAAARPRSQSRGRKTALKALREALTAGHSHHGLGGDGEGAGQGGKLNGGAGEEHVVGDGWKEFKAGTYTYPISIPVPASLPPSLHCEFGNVTYTLKATVHRAGALTANLTASTDVTLVTTPHDEDVEENESIVVERFWETQCKYHVAISGKSFPIGGQIPISIRLNPLAKIKLYRVSAQLEQKTSYFAAVNSGRKLTRHETPKRFQLLRIEHKDPKEPLLPILSDDPDALVDHPLKSFFVNAQSSDDTTPSLLDPLSPWQLDGYLQLPDCSTKISFSTHHDKANIAVAHNLKIMLRVERGDDEYLDSKGKRKLFDIIVETNLHILSCRLLQNLLPSYSAATPLISGPSSSSSGLGSRLGRSSRPTTSSATSHCSHHGPSSSSHHTSGLHLSLNPSSSSRSHDPPVATLEQNLLFARLISGETTPAGETPPTYDAVVEGMAPVGVAPVGPVVVEAVRGRAEQVGEDEERGRSSSTRRGR
ncbi:hypothetical protein JCM8547_003988 [Rhodosporidiobolus lusitaniae]